MNCHVLEENAGFQPDYHLLVGVEFDGGQVDYYFLMEDTLSVVAWVLGLEEEYIFSNEVYHCFH